MNPNRTADETMTRDRLLETARALPASAPGVLADYEANRGALVAAVDRALLARPDLDDLIGPGNRALMQDNHRNHAEFIAALLLRCDPQVLTDSVLWVFRTYRARGFRPAYWPVELAAWVSAGEVLLAADTRAALAPLYTWLRDHCRDFTALTDAPAATAIGSA